MRTVKKRFEGRWKCLACTAVNRGLYKTCHNCGAAKENAKNYAPSEGERTDINDPELLKLATAGPDWICPSCKTNNPNFAQHCTNCGDGKGGAKQRQTHIYDTANVPDSEDEAVADNPATVVTLPDVTPVSDYSNVSVSTENNDDIPLTPSYTDTSVESHAPSSQAFWGETSKPNRKVSSSTLQIVGIGLVLAVIAGLVFFLTRSHEVTAQVSGFNWSRTIYIDRYVTTQESDWSIPGGGRQLSVQDKVHHYVEVFDHNEEEKYTVTIDDGSEEYECGSETIDEGNGFFTEETKYCTRYLSHEETRTRIVPVYRDEPVYKPWYTYEIDKWVPSRTVPTSGTSRTDPAPFWAGITLDYSGQTIIGAERESNRTQTYTVSFTYDDGKVYTREVSEADWNSYDPTVTYTLVINNMGMILNDPLRPERK